MKPGSCTDDNNNNHGHRATRALTFSMALLSFTLVAELIGGWLTGSLALLADAGHVFMDLFALGVSLGAALLARRPPTSTRTFGWHRAEILAAMLNGLLLAALALGLLHAAWERMQHPKAVLAIPMLVVAVMGLAVNIVIAFRLHRPHETDLNLRSAYLHVLGDAGASIGVIIAAVIIHTTGWYMIDPLMSTAICVVILIGAVRLLIQAGHILLEGVPSRLSLQAVAEAIQAVEGVKDVHDVHIWTVCSHIVSLSCHMTIDWNSPEDHDRMTRVVSELLWKKFQIMHSTIQVDYRSCGSPLISTDMEHREPDGHSGHSH